MRCKVCRTPFKKLSISHKVCSADCAIIWGEMEKAKKQRKADREAKVRLRSRREWLQLAQKAFNKYVRARDHGKPCISCGAPLEQRYGGTIDCSHYRSTGSASHLRFNLHNAAAGCVKCNRYLSGNAVEYRKRLIDKIGIEKVEALEANNEPRKFDIEYLSRICRIFTKKAKRITRR